MSTKKEYIILTLILLLSLLLRLCLFTQSTFIATDGVAFSRLGENLIQTGNYAFCENYNMGIGGEGGSHFKGKKHTKEMKEALSKKMTGIIHTKERRAKISDIFFFVCDFI